MRLLRLTLLTITGVMLAVADDPKPKAYLRIAKDGTTLYVAVLPDPPQRATAQPRDIQALLFKKGRLLTTNVELPKQDDKLHYYDDDAAFRIILPKNSLTNDFSGLSVTVVHYPTAAGTGVFSAPVDKEITPSIDANNARCYPRFALDLAADPDTPPSTYVMNEWTALNKYLKEHAPTTRVESRTQAGTQSRNFLIGSGFKNATTQFSCFALAPEPPSGSYDLQLSFAINAPVELRSPILKTDLSRAPHDDAPLKIDDTEIGKRSIEQNLDLGVQYASAVTTNDDGTRKRTNTGTLDLRLAPLLNALPAPKPGSNTLWFLTPFSVNARVSTGRITKDTIAQNVIVVGSEVEARHYTDPSTYPTYQRIIFGISNASDRDFHHAEWKGTLEFQPVFSGLNHPLRWGQQTEASILDPDPDREPKHIPSAHVFGWQVLPTVGGELGHTWRNHQDLATIESTTAVRRFYFGGTINLDITRYVALSGEDLLYVRGEAPLDRLHNYLLASANVPLPAFSVNMAQSVFFSYERGGQPPFATPDTNALKIGFRIQWDGWFGKPR